MIKINKNTNNLDEINHLKNIKFRGGNYV